MKKVFQTVVGNGDNGEHGNCMQAVVASLFSLELEDVPNFISFDTGNGEANIKMWEFFMEKGFHPSAFGTYDTPIEKYKEVCQFDEGINGYFYASVKSQTFEDTSHAVIVDSNLEIVHDPNPNSKCLGMELNSGNLNYILTFGDWYIDLEDNFVMNNKEYNDWLTLREESKNNDEEPGRGLCYCGHTKYCECSDPDETTFSESAKRGAIIAGDPNNGWKKVNDMDDVTKSEEALLDIKNNLETFFRNSIKNSLNFDLGDIGNEIGFAVAKHFSGEMGFDKESFLSGIRHGISLVDGTHP